VKFESIYGEQLSWKLLTPVPFIQAMNQETIPEMAAPLTNITVELKKKGVDITRLVFENDEEFLQFLYVNK
jgi:hypothetical protein